MTQTLTHYQAGCRRILKRARRATLPPPRFSADEHTPYTRFACRGTVLSLQTRREALPPPLAHTSTSLSTHFHLP